MTLSDFSERRQLRSWAFWGGIVLQSLIAIPLAGQQPRQQVTPIDTRPAAPEYRPAPASLRLAPRSQANRKTTGSIKKPAATTPANAIATVIGSLAIVLGLFVIIAWCARRLAPAGSAPLPNEAVELLGRAPLAGRQQMQLIRVGNKLLLVALSPTGSETLTEIVEPQDVEHMLGLCRRGQAGSSAAVFQQVLAQIEKEPAQRGFVGSARQSARGAG